MSDTDQERHASNGLRSGLTLTRRIGRRLLRAPAEPTAFEVLIERANTVESSGGPRVNVGSGALPIGGWINSDRVVLPGVAVVVDADGGLPFATGSCSAIVAKDVIEHVDHVHLLREVWRVLEPGGIAVLSTPHYTSRFLWIDPTHRRGFSVLSFDYFEEFRQPQRLLFRLRFDALEQAWVTFGVPNRYWYHRWIERWVNSSRDRAAWYEGSSSFARTAPGS